MSPRPSLRHSEVASRLLTLLNIPFLKGKECLAYSEADIRYKDTYLVPDVSLRCVGQELPLIVFEVLSPGSRRYDLLVKPSAYQSLGILEYWIIDPEERSGTRLQFNECRCASQNLSQWANHSIQCKAGDYHSRG